MFCRKCGKEIPNDSEFCPHCGEWTLAKMGPVPNAPETAIPPKSTGIALPGREKPARKGVPIRWVVTGVIVFLLIGIIGFSSILSTIPSSHGTETGTKPQVISGTPIPTISSAPSSNGSFWVRPTPAGFRAGYSNTDKSGDGQMLRAEIGFFPQGGSAPLTVRFTDKSRGFPTSWSWDFGDGTRSSEESPSHTFSSAGTYYVGLTVSGDGVQSSARAGPFIVRAPGSGGAMSGSQSLEKSGQVGQAVLKYTNIEREKRNLPPLKWNSQLALVAKAHSELMAGTGMMEHLLPGEMPLQTRLIDGDVPNAGAGENLARIKSGSDPDAIGASCVYLWVWDDASENWGHRHNILDGITSDPGYNDNPYSAKNPEGYGNAGYTEMGAGASEGTINLDGKTYTVIYVTQDFLSG